MKNLTMKDIAKEMGISTVTISKALSDKEGVGSVLRGQIKAKAAEMGYVYNDIPKLMREGKTSNIGIIISKKYLDGYSFYLQFYQMLLKQLQKVNYYGLLEVISHEDEASEKKPLILINKKVDGFIVLGQLSDKYLTSLTCLDIPCVFLDFFSDIGQNDCVVSNNYFGSYTATKHLIDHGHKKIAFIGSPSSTDSILDRYLGYCKALIGKGLPYYQAVLDRNADGEYVDFEIDAGKYTAYVCNNDEVAKRLITKLGKCNLRVPEDISVVGFDNYINDNITSIEVDIAKMTRSAVDILVNKINTNGRYSVGRFLVECKLVAKESVMPLRKLNNV